MGAHGHCLTPSSTFSPVLLFQVSGGVGGEAMGSRLGSEGSVRQDPQGSSKCHRYTGVAIFSTVWGRFWLMCSANSIAAVATVHHAEFPQAACVIFPALQGLAVAPSILKRNPRELPVCLHAIRGCLVSCSPLPFFFFFSHRVMLLVARGLDAV